MNLKDQAEGSARLDLHQTCFNRARASAVFAGSAILPFA
jgi:hypothetical protein